MRPRDASEPVAAGPPPRARSRLERFVRRLWWLHSLWALAFGVGVMIYARKGLAHADKMLLFLAASWLIVFLALRFIVGPDKASPDDPLHKKGLRLATNYVIKNLYQQMFFFLVPLYASSTTWSLASKNLWLAPLLLACAVLSTMDLVMDEFIMQRRAIAALLYGVCLLGVLNLMLPLALGLTHFHALLLAAAATAPAVALLTFRLRTVFRPLGLSLVAAATGLLLAGAYYHPEYVPPAPLAMSKGGVGHGRPGQYETVPQHRERIRASELDNLRCVTLLTQPGGVRDDIDHIWRHRGQERVRFQVEPTPQDRERGSLYVSRPLRLPPDPRGPWSCRIETGDGQLVGELRFEIVD